MKFAIPTSWIAVDFTLSAKARWGRGNDLSRTEVWHRLNPATSDKQKDVSLGKVGQYSTTRVYPLRNQDLLRVGVTTPPPPVWTAKKALFFVSLRRWTVIKKRVVLEPFLADFLLLFPGTYFQYVMKNYLELPKRAVLFRHPPPPQGIHSR